MSHLTRGWFIAVLLNMLSTKSFEEADCSVGSLSTDLSAVLFSYSPQGDTFPASERTQDCGFGFR